MDSQFCCYHYRDLSKDLLYKILQLRINVYVLEQKWIYQDLDDIDTSAYHVWHKDGENICCTSRFYSQDNTVWLGRIIVSKNKRRNGLGSKLMDYTCYRAAQLFPDRQIKLHSPPELQKFYEIHGFKNSGVELFIQGAPYFEMIKK